MAPIDIAAVHEAADTRVNMTTAPNFEQFQGFSKQQVEAFTAASATFTKGLQEIAAESTDYSKKAFAAGSAVVEKLLAARSVEAAVQIQSDYAKQAYEGFVAQASRFPSSTPRSRPTRDAGLLRLKARIGRGHGLHRV